MTDWEERFRVLDRLESPDLWSDIEQRGPRSHVPTPRRGGRITIVFIALAVSSLAIWLAAVAFRSNVPQTKPQPIAPVPGVRNGVIAYLGTIGEADQQAVFVINADGSERKQLTGGMDSSGLSWSPDGRQILFDRGTEGEGELVVMNADGSDLHPIASEPGSAFNGPVWSPDGTRIAYISGDSELRVMDADGANDRRVLDNPADCFPGNGLSWSPDSMRLVYVLECEPEFGQTTSIEVVGADGTGRKALIGPADVIPLNSAAGYSEPAWSPDGDHILFVDTQESESLLQSQIHVMNADGSGVRRLTKEDNDNHSPVWSPDGSFIAFISDQDGTYQIWVMKADGTGARKVTNEADNWSFAPAWQPIPSAATPSPMPTG